MGAGGEVRIDRGLALSSGVGRGGKGAIERGEGARGAAESMRRKERGAHRTSVARDGRSEEGSVEGARGAVEWAPGARGGEPVGVSGVACSRLLRSTRICHASFRAIHILRAAKEWLTYNGSIISHI